MQRPAFLFLLSTCPALLLAQHVDDLLSDDPGLSLATVVEQATARHPDAVAIAALEREAAAVHDVAATVLSAAPALTVRHNRDTPGEDFGVQEYEAMLELPLKRPGESRAWRHLAAATEALRSSQDGALSWRVAGLVREALWDVVMSRARVALSERAVAEAEALADAVETRVELGDLATIDLLEARARQLQHEAQAVEVRGQLADAVRRYVAVVGHSRIPTRLDEPEPRHPAFDEAHPALVAAAAGVERGAAMTELAGVRALGNPVLSVGPRWERGQSGAPFADTLGVILRLPFGGGDFRQLAEAQAAREGARARSREAEVRRELDLALHEAEHELATTRAAAKLATEAARLGEQRLAKVRFAFDAGEADLAALLRAQGSALDTSGRARLLGLETQRAVVRLNQALGRMPATLPNPQPETDDE
ncbi:MAG: TolC family protein [Gammaproteobacteria bacterium]